MTSDHLLITTLEPRLDRLEHYTVCEVPGTIARLADEMRAEHELLHRRVGDLEAKLTKWIDQLWAASTQTEERLQSNYEQLSARIDALHRRLGDLEGYTQVESERTLDLQTHLNWIEERIARLEADVRADKQPAPERVEVRADKEPAEELFSAMKEAGTFEQGATGLDETFAWIGIDTETGGRAEFRVSKRDMQHVQLLGEWKKRILERLDKLEADVCADKALGCCICGDDPATAFTEPLPCPDCGCLPEPAEQDDGGGSRTPISLATEWELAEELGRRTRVSSYAFFKIRAKPQQEAK